MERRAEQIYSTLADDPAQGDVIDAFVVTLAERIDTLQDLDSHSELTELAANASELSLDAAKAGFASLSRGAAGVADAAGEGGRATSHKALVELTEIARRIRLGHRGAV